MAKDNSGGSHTVMPKKLAQALMEAGMQHFDVGGRVNLDGAGPGQSTAAGGGNPYGSTADAFEHGDVQRGITSGSNPMEAINGIGAGIQGLGQAFTAQNHYNAALAPQMQSDYSGLIQQGGQNSLNTYSQQQNLANALLSQSRGQGPNPAQAQLAQSTGQNVAQQGALMASQRGASANAGLMARQAAQQGAGIQQNAAGQAALLQAQQQIAAQQQAAALYGQMGNQSNQLYSSSIAGQNTQNANAIQNYGMVQGINSQVAQGNVNAQNQTTGGILGALGGGGASSLFSEGGEVASVQIPTLTSQGVVFSGADGKKKKKDGGSSDDGMKPLVDGSMEGDASGGAGYFGSSGPMMYAAEGGEVADVDVPGFSSDSAPGSWAAKKDGGGGGGGLMKMLPMLMALQQGGPVPGKAQVSGNSVANDKVPALLSPGEIVLPRSVTQGGNIEKKAIEFLRHLKKGKKGFNEVIEARHTKRMCGGGKVK